MEKSQYRDIKSKSIIRIDTNKYHRTERVNQLIKKKRSKNDVDEIGIPQKNLNRNAKPGWEIWIQGQTIQTIKAD